MDWGSGITYVATTTFRGKEVPFGIKDRDRLEHVSVVGKGGAGRAALFAQMILQDAKRGIGTVVLDASGGLTEVLLERIDPSMRDRLVYLDPSDAEYPFSWNVMDDVRSIPEEFALPLLSDLITALYRVPTSPLSDFAALHMLGMKNATPLFLFELLTDQVFRDTRFPKGSAERSELDALIAGHADIADSVRGNGRYLARDTLMRNLLGQQDSKFTLDLLNEGSIFVVDLSRVRMFPTRLTPIVRLFLHAMRMRTVTMNVPPSLYVEDCIRCFSDRDIEWFFAERRIMGAIADGVHIEEDKEFREKTLSRSGSILAFTPSTADTPVIERVYFPYIGLEDFNKLDANEVAVLLTIDSVRARPFFGDIAALPPRKSISYHDIQVECREKFATSRHIVDRLFIKARTPSEAKPGTEDAGSFSSAFRSIFAKSATLPAATQSPQSSSAPVSSPLPKTTSQPQADVNKEPDEIPEDELKQMLYVRPLGF